jgi:hypothetical protein
MGGFRPVQCRNAGKTRRLAARPTPSAGITKKRRQTEGRAKTRTDVTSL